MPIDNTFVENVLDRLQLSTTVICKKMFGGYGLFHDGIMFALIADNELFLKTDGQSSHFFKAMNLPPFSYDKARRKTVRLSYYLAPESFFEEPEETLLWTQRALDAARRAHPGAKKNR